MIEKECIQYLIMIKKNDKVINTDNKVVINDNKVTTNDNKVVINDNKVDNNDKVTIPEGLPPIPKHLFQHRINPPNTKKEHYN